MTLWTGPWAPLLRWPLAATTAVGLVAILTSAVVAGRPGAIGAVLGAVVTIVFFTISLLVMAATARLDPRLVMGVALLTYGVKVSLLLTLLIALFGAPWLSGRSLALTVIACTATWLAAQMVGARRARIPVYDLPDDVAK